MTAIATTSGLDGQRIFVISPDEFYPLRKDGTPHKRGSRAGYMTMFAHIIDDLGGFTDGVTTISPKKIGVAESPEYWGGDGILVTIDPAYDAEKLANVINGQAGGELAIVYDPATRTYYGHNRIVRPEAPKGLN